LRNAVLRLVINACSSTVRLSSFTISVCHPLSAIGNLYVVDPTAINVLLVLFFIVYYAI